MAGASKDRPVAGQTSAGRLAEPGAALDGSAQGVPPDRGLDSAEAERRLEQEGPNELPSLRRPSMIGQLAGQFTHLLAVLLWVAAGLALLAGQPPLAVAIVFIIVLNAVFAFAQELRADRSAERLQRMLPVTARVRRDGVPRRLPGEQVVRGDVVLLTSGDRVPADLVLVTSPALAVDESMVTGESAAVRRSSGERVLAGTFVIQGEAEGTVAATGARTEIAAIARMTRAARRPPSPLHRQLGQVVRVVAIIAIIAGAALGSGGLAMGLHPTQAFLFGVGVAVALVPEGLLPTVTLSLARGASLMARRNALVRRLDAVETLGATTIICTDKTGTLTQNRMAVVEVWTPVGAARISGEGYAPEAVVEATPEVVERMRTAAAAARACTSGRVLRTEAGWRPDGDPMEAALDAWGHRVRAVDDDAPVRLRQPYTADRLLSSVAVGDRVRVLGAPEAVLARCRDPQVTAQRALAALTARGRRVIAVAGGSWRPGAAPDELEQDLDLIALVGIEDPPRPDVGQALKACHEAGIRVAMVTGDHPGTAVAVAREVGLLGECGAVLDGARLPPDEELVAALESADGAVVARVSPAAKLQIARALRQHGHVVAMTGDGVNDAPALREADVGVAMGLSGSDVAREAADLVLLDDHFATIVAAIELGRATFVNVRRFLTYHLTDNVAELAPFAVWALSAGQIPLAIGVLQVLALDIGTDLLPALALGAEAPSPRIMLRSPHQRRLIDPPLLLRSLGLLGLTEALAAMTAFLVVLGRGGWSWGAIPDPALLATASGTAFATIVLAQMANAFACRSESRPAWRLPLLGNRLLLMAVAVELGLLLAFLAFPPAAALLGGSLPPPLGWLAALGGALLVLLVDATQKAVRRRVIDRPRP
ncbi:MAG TPA: cation-transporting P-type ATPase [Microlunatus sp.]|nr:cation-transporting P-type ATPase [Microlunatus sp.]